MVVCNRHYFKLQFICVLTQPSVLFWEHVVFQDEAIGPEIASLKERMQKRMRPHYQVHV